MCCCSTLVIDVYVLMVWATYGFHVGICMCCISVHLSGSDNVLAAMALCLLGVLGKGALLMYPFGRFPTRGEVGFMYLAAVNEVVLNT